MMKLYLLGFVTVMLGCTTQQERIALNHPELSGTAEDSRLANLERAARLPWTDDGRCAVQESSGTWASLVERCFDALDHERIRFVDHEGRCPIAQAGAISADDAMRLVGICLLVQPEIAVGAVIVIGVVVVGVVIAEAIAAESSRLKCNCFCIGVDDLGRRHGPYKYRPVRNQYVCEQACLSEGYKGGGFCR